MLIAHRTFGCCLSNAPRTMLVLFLGVKPLIIGSLFAAAFTIASGDFTTRFASTINVKEHYFVSHLSVLFLQSIKHRAYNVCISTVSRGGHTNQSTMRISSAVWRNHATRKQSCMYNIDSTPPGSQQLTYHVFLDSLMSYNCEAEGIYTFEVIDRNCPR